MLTALVAVLVVGAAAGSPVASLMLSSPLLETQAARSTAAPMGDAASVILHAMGLPAHLGDTAATMPATNMFSRPRLSVTFVVDGSQSGTCISRCFSCPAGECGVAKAAAARRGLRSGRRGSRLRLCLSPLGRIEGAVMEYGARDSYRGGNTRARHHGVATEVGG